MWWNKQLIRTEDLKYKIYFNNPFELRFLILKLWIQLILINFYNLYEFSKQGSYILYFNLRYMD